MHLSNVFTMANENALANSGKWRGVVHASVTPLDSRVYPYPR